MHVRAAATAVQLEQVGVKMLRIVPLPHNGWVHRRLIVDCGAEGSYFLVVDALHALMEFGQHVRQRCGLAD